MFVRIRERKLKQGRSQYAYLVDNHWNTFKKKHEQKIVASLGSVSSLPTNGVIEKIIVALDSFAAKLGFSSLANGIVLSDIEDEKFLSSSYDFGSLLLTNQVLKNLSLDAIVKQLSLQNHQREISTDKIISCLQALLAYRLYPRTAASDLKTFNWYDKNVFLPNKKELTLDDLYRTLDVLISNKDEIERCYYERNRDLFNGELDIVLFDTTSVYYFGKQNPERVYRDTDLLQYGFSKDGRGDLKQLIVGVLMTKDGVPIAHEVFPGNTADVKSFSKIITIVKEKYHIGKIIFIADRGMVSEENIVHLEQSELSYIVGIRMRKLPNTLQEKLLIPLDDEKPTETMDRVTDNLYTKEFKVERLSDKELKELFVDKIIKGKTATFDKEDILEKVKKRRFFVCFNPYVAHATKVKRAYFKKIIKNKITYTPTKEWIIKNGYKKYLTFPDGINPILDEERLKNEEIYDGKWILLTNDQTVSSSQAGMYYKTLQTIERGFRDLKSLITIRPIYHYKEERIRAHVFVCFLALVIKWYICRMISLVSQEEGRRFIEEMTNLKAIAVDPAIPLYVRTAISPATQEHMKKLRMKVPGKVILDGRQKPEPISHKPGRPRKSNLRYQLSLITNDTI